MNKSLPPFLPAKIGSYRPPKVRYVRITAESCVHDFDMHMLNGAQPIHGFVEHIPSGERRKAVFTRLKIHGVPEVMLAHRVTGTLYRQPDGISSSPDLRAVVK